MSREAAVCLMLVLAGCANIPDVYAPPVQRNPQTTPEPGPISQFVNMSDANVEAHLVRDFLPANDQKTWRWTGQSPEMRFLLAKTEGLRFAMDFAVPELTFRQRGPVSISVVINGHPLESIRCDKPGERHFEKAVPSEWLRTHLPNLVVARIDKVWVAPSDGARLGFILVRAGFLD